MAYDEGVAQRLREALGEEDGVVEKKMFGGIAFMHRGNMCCGVAGEELMRTLSPALSRAAANASAWTSHAGFETGVSRSMAPPHLEHAGPGLVASASFVDIALQSLQRNRIRSS